MHSRTWWTESGLAVRRTGQQLSDHMKSAAHAVGTWPHVHRCARSAGVRISPRATPCPGSGRLDHIFASAPRSAIDTLIPWLVRTQAHVRESTRTFAATAAPRLQLARERIEERTVFHGRFTPSPVHTSPAAWAQRGWKHFAKPQTPDARRACRSGLRRCWSPLCSSRKRWRTAASRAVTSSRPGSSRQIHTSEQQQRSTRRRRSHPRKRRDAPIAGHDDRLDHCQCALAEEGQRARAVLSRAHEK